MVKEHTPGLDQYVDSNSRLHPAVPTVDNASHSGCTLPYLGIGDVCQ
jgi:hypothetical protein